MNDLIADDQNFQIFWSFLIASMINHSIFSLLLLRSLKLYVKESRDNDYVMHHCHKAVVHVYDSSPLDHSKS